MQTLAQLLPLTESGLFSSMSMPFSAVMIYQPKEETTYRVAWYGGESTQLHFQVLNLEEWRWEDRDVRTLGSGVPAGIKEMLLEMENYYHDSLILEQERKYNMM